jgi:ATP-binding cassette subfamily F protein 3
VQSRIKQLDKVERIEVDMEDTSRLSLKFPPAPRSGSIPSEIENYNKSVRRKNHFTNKLVNH